MTEPTDFDQGPQPNPTRRDFARGVVAATAATAVAPAADPEPARPFGDDFPNLGSFAVGEWWTKKPAENAPNLPPPMDVPRDHVVAFALYTVDHGVLKMSAQLFPLKPEEPREARLEVERDGKWVELLKAPVLYPGWSAHFRVEKWDATKSVKYRVRHGEKATFEGTIRRDPADKDVIVVANMSCNSSRTTGGRPEIVKHLHAPDHHSVTNLAKDETPGERKAGPAKPTGYWPGRTTQRRQSKRRKKPGL